MKRWITAVIALFIICAASGCSADNLPPQGQGDTAMTSPDIHASATPETSESGLEVAAPPEMADAPITEAPVAPTVETAPNTTPQEPVNEDLVRVLDYIPSIYVDLKYATEDNFTGTVIYDFSDPYLRYGTVKKLAEVQSELLTQGYSLKIWDAYRPISAQFALWEVCPDPVYVANPNTGYSSHSKGNTVDVTIVMSDGTELAMPTDFDDFSALADRDYSDVSEEATANALILENAMSAHGFNCYSGEWWHFSDSTAYSVIEE